MEKRIIKADICPKTIEYLNDGSYYYNYNPLICQIERQDLEGNIELYSGYSYIQVHLYGMPDYKNIVKAIIRAHITEDEEFDMINTYNKSVLFNEDVDLVKYKEYLELLATIKNNVKISLL